MTTTLRREDQWVALKPLTDRTARVEDGTLFLRGDRVKTRDGRPWEDLARPRSSGDTEGDPSTLELVYDVVTGHSPSFAALEIAAALEVEDPDSSWRFLEVDLLLDDPDALARAFAEEIERPARPARRGEGLRRRRTDVA